MPTACWCTRYEPHIFHTNSERAWNRLSRFTEWQPYEHRVLSAVDSRHYPFPDALRRFGLSA